MLKFVHIFFLLFAPCVVFAQYTEEQIHTAIRQVGGIEIFVKEMAGGTAKNLPMMTNANAEIMSVFALGKQLAYTTRLVNVNKSSVSDLEELKKSNISYVGCKSPVLSLLIREYGVEVTYVVTSKDNEFLFEYRLNRKTCAKK